jgi:hypothetical protein
VGRGLSPTLISLKEARYSHFRQPDDGGGLVGRSTSAADRSSDVRGSRCAPTGSGSTGCGNSVGGVAVVHSGDAAACLPACVPRSLGCGLTGFIPLPCSGPTSGRSGTPVGSAERCCARKSPVSKPSDTRSPPNVACFPQRTLARRLDATLPPSEAASEPPAQVPDHDGVSVGALVQQVRQVLGRAHALFGDPASSGGSAAAGAGGRLAGAGDVVRSGQSQISALSGQFAAGYGLFAASAGLALDDLAGADERLSTRLCFDSVALQQIWF